MSTKTILHLIFTPLKCTICFETILSAIYVRTRTEPWAVGVLFVYRRRSTRRTIWSRSKAINLCTNKNMNILFILPGSGGGGRKTKIVIVSLGLCADYDVSTYERCTITYNIILSFFIILQTFCVTRFQPKWSCTHFLYVLHVIVYRHRTSRSFGNGIRVCGRQWRL